MCKKLFVCLAVIAGYAYNAQSQLNDHLVYQVPAMAQAMARPDVLYKTVNDTALHFDIYYPKNHAVTKPLPVVIFNNGVGAMNFPQWGGYKDWGKLVAANGMAGVIYQARPGSTLQDGEALIDYLAANSKTLGIDAGKMGMFTSSANTPTGARLAIKTRSQFIKALVIYYGVVDSIGELRQDLPTLMVSAGLDAQFINLGREYFVQSNLMQDTRFEFINFLHGLHAFDIFTNTNESRAIIKHTVEFFKTNLTNPVIDTAFTVTNRNFMWLIMHGQSQKAFSEFRKAWAKYTADSAFNPFYNGVLRENALNENAYWLLQHLKQDDALETFKLIAEKYPESPNAYDGLADAYEAIGNKTEAFKNAQLALQKLDKATNIDAQFKESIRRSAKQKIERLKQ